MRSIKIMLAGTLLTLAPSTYADPQATTPVDVESYALKAFSADFRLFKSGDTVPPLYLTEQYAITQWKLRNLPAPEACSHWTYMGGNYVLITDTEGKILKAYNGDIFYHR